MSLTLCSVGLTTQTAILTKITKILTHHPHHTYNYILRRTENNLKLHTKWPNRQSNPKHTNQWQWHHNTIPKSHADKIIYYLQGNKHTEQLKRNHKSKAFWLSLPFFSSLPFFPQRYQNYTLEN